MTTIASQNKIAVMACKTLTVDDTIRPFYGHDGTAG